MIEGRYHGPLWFEGKNICTIWCWHCLFSFLKKFGVLMVFFVQSVPSKVSNYALWVRVVWLLSGCFDSKAWCHYSPAGNSLTTTTLEPKGWRSTGSNPSMQISSAAVARSVGKKHQPPWRKSGCLSLRVTFSSIETIFLTQKHKHQLVTASLPTYHFKIAEDNSMFFNAIHLIIIHSIHLSSIFVLIAHHPSSIPCNSTLPTSNRLWGP